MGERGQAAWAYALALRQRFGPAVGLYVGLKVLGLLVFLKLLSYSGDYLERPTRFGGGARPIDVLGSWDGWWYERIARIGYHPVLIHLAGDPGRVKHNSTAFFPLYPALMRGVADVTPFGLFGAGMIVSVLASVFAAAGIFAVVEQIGGTRAGILAAGLWAVAPGSGAEWAVYSDSVFIALAAWSCYCVMTKRWWLAGALALVAGLNRPTAVALIGAVGLAALVALWRREGDWKGPVGAIVLAPIGLAGYVGWVGWRAGQWDAYVVLERGAWGHYFDWGAGTFHAMRGVALARYDYGPAHPVADLIGALVVIALPTLLVALLVKRTPVVLVAYTLATLVLTLGSTGFFSNTSRYSLAAFPLLIPLALGLRNVRWPLLAVLLVTAALASGWYAGYAIFELGIP